MLKTKVATLLAVLVTAATAATAATANHVSVTTREAWRMSDEERIAQRVDRSLATARLRTALRSRSAVATASRSETSTRWTDVIDGKQNPELFLPTELFQELVQNAYRLDVWREFYAKRIIQAGLPPDFWERLRVVSGPFFSDVARSYQLRAGAKANPIERDTVAAQLTALSPTMCRDRAVALQRARAEFGEPLDRLLYGYVATEMTLYIDDFSSADRLRFQLRGCQ